MKTKIKVLAIVMAMVLALTGCSGSVDYGMSIGSDGSVKATIVILAERAGVAEAMLDTYQSILGNSITAEMVAAYMDEAVKEEDGEIVTIDDVQYYRIEQSQSMSNKEALKSLNSDGAVGYVSADTFYEAAGVDSITSSTSLAVDSSELKNYDVKLMVSLEFTAPVVASNGTVSEENPNVVNYTYDLATTNDITIFATTKDGVTMDSIKQYIKSENTLKASKITKTKALKVAKKAKKAKVYVRVQKVAKAKGYQIQYSTKKTMKGAKSVKIKKLKTTLQKLKKGTKYFVRVRAYRVNFAGNTVYSKWSAKKAVKTKK